MRVGVIGSGVVGACAAFALASEGERVTLFEQFSIDHDRGSSFGDSRIIRRFYDDPYYTSLTSAAYDSWASLERASGRTLYERFGGLYFGPRGHARLLSAEAGMRSAVADPVLVDAGAMRARFPAFAFADDEVGIFDERAGSLRASQCVVAAVDAARASGVELRERTLVERVVASPDGGVVLRLADGEIAHFDRAIICAGPWTARLVAPLRLPIAATRQQYAYIRPVRDRAMFSSGTLPIWIDAASNWYGFPEHGEIEGVKFASHDFGPHIDPDDVDRSIDETQIERARAYARRRLPALDGGDVTYAKVCLYTVTPDEDFIVDAVPGVPGCAFFAGCSGHAFKFGALLGEVLSDLARDVEPRVDITRFRVARFAQT